MLEFALQHLGSFLEYHMHSIYVPGPLTTQAGCRHAVWVFSILQYVYPDLTMTIHGDGVEQERIEAWKAGITFGDAVSIVSARVPMQELLSEADMVWLPRQVDDVPSAAIWAVEYGKPILASRFPAMQQCLHSYEQVTFLPHDQPPLWATEMHRLLKNQALAVAA